VAGKMGPTIGRMAQRALAASGSDRRVIGVARFSNPAEREKLNDWGIDTIACDLLNEGALAKLPDASHVMFMAGMKFGSTGNEALTWAMNCHLPAMVCRRYQGSTIAAFSTGNVYGLTPLATGGSIETDAANPAGEYAMSCLGRERMFQHFAQSTETPVSILRLNYACELRYGVLVDLAQKVWERSPIDLAMGNFNVIWQADANAMALASFAQAGRPAFMLNIAGPETLSVRCVCQQFGLLMGRDVQFVGTEAPDALLNNGQLGHRLYGYPRVGAEQMMHWIADWIIRGGETLKKPTHFETRSGKF
ncbi:MAG: dependent epimerase/dehydratase family protein, partial [Phycisphaerales bacterium]|nr:dependent epimerase/dehydratase family protein [Phycisphaerales bacterium]